MHCGENGSGMRRFAQKERRGMSRGVNSAYYQISGSNGISHREALRIIEIDIWGNQFALIQMCSCQMQRVESTQRCRETRDPLAGKLKFLRANWQNMEIAICQVTLEFLFGQFGGVDIKLANS